MKEIEAKAKKRNFWSRIGLSKPKINLPPMIIPKIPNFIKFGHLSA